MNLETNYLGLRISSPLIVGASPFCDDLYQVQNLEEAGAGALVMRSLFSEHATGLPGPAPEPEPGATTEDVDFAAYQLSPALYLRHVEALKQRVTIPVIASLNSGGAGQWSGIAAQLESAGADAIELNFYRVVTDVAIAADQVEREMIETVRSVVDAVKIPVAVKLSPFHTALAQLAVALELAGAAGLVLFNRFYQPDINIADLEVQPQLRLSVPEETLLRLRWLAILSPKLRTTLVATGGFQTAGDVVKALLTGATSVQVVSVLLRHGPLVMRTLNAGLGQWMQEHGYASVDDFRGRLALNRVPDAAVFERANYLRTLQSWSHGGR